MTKILAAILCLALSIPARAGEDKPSEGSDRPAKVRKSLEKMEKRIGQTRAQLDRLEAQIRELREELGGGRPSETPKAPPVSEEPTALPMPKPEPNDGVLRTRMTEPEAGPVPGPVGKDGSEQALVYSINDSNFGSSLGEEPQTPDPNLDSEYMLIVSPEGNKVVAFDKTTKRSIPLTLSDDPQSHHQVRPFQDGSVVGLAITGPGISRLAVFANKQAGGIPAWHPIELRVPVEKAEPEIQSYRSVLYLLGRYVYAYSPRVGRWDILELPEGVVPERGYSRTGPTLAIAEHLYTFSVDTGKWSDLDTRAILDGDQPRKVKE